MGARDPAIPRNAPAGASNDARGFISGPCRIETQGFLGLDDRTIHQVNFWRLLSPMQHDPAVTTVLIRAGAVGSRAHRLLGRVVPKPSL